MSIILGSDIDTTEKDTNKEKVFCSECKYRDRLGWYCQHSENKVFLGDTHWEKGSFGRGLCYKINANNNCAKFESDIYGKWKSLLQRVAKKF